MAAALSRVYAGLCRRDRLTSKKCPFWFYSLFCDYDDPNDMWRVWVDMLMNVVNKHAPIRETRNGKKRSPWITPNILQQMRSRDYFKKKFETTKDISTWNLYKKARNEVNNNLKQSKRDYFSTNLDLAKNDPKKT